MMKFNNSANLDKSNDFVSELKNNPLLEGYDINVSNANDFSVYLEELHNYINIGGNGYAWHIENLQIFVTTI